jgi:predicted membrane protein
MYVNESAFRARNASRLFVGLVILALGSLALLDNFGVVRIVNVWRMWPLILVAVGMAKLLQARGSHGRFPGALFLIVGLWLLGQNLGVWPYSLGQLWPLLVVALGVFLVWGALGRRREEPLPTDASRISSFSMLGGVEHRNKSLDFRGGDATAILGGCKLDLHQAAIKSGEAVLEVFAMWGGIEIWVPREWNIVIQGTPIMGAFEDKTDGTRAEGAPRLVVRGAVIMGGVEIKN